MQHCSRLVRVDSHVHTVISWLTQRCLLGPEASTVMIKQQSATKETFLSRGPSDRSWLHMRRIGFGFGSETGRRRPQPNTCIGADLVYRDTRIRIGTCTSISTSTSSLATRGVEWHGVISHILVKLGWVGPPSHSYPPIVSVAVVTLAC